MRLEPATSVSTTEPQTEPSPSTPSRKPAGERGYTPRVHGNGFIQLALTPKTRLHVWAGDSRLLNRQNTDTGWHTHRFDYRSVVLRGKLAHYQYTFRLDPRGPVELYVPTSNERLSPTGVKGHLDTVSVRELIPGDTYELVAGAFHYINPIDRLSATLMTKTREYDMPVYVGCYQAPDNDFDRDKDNDPEKLWKLIEEVLDR